MKYASDNALVQRVYDITLGTYKPIFVCAVAAICAVAIYLPVRELYIAHRVNEVLEQQLEIREKYNASLEKEVDGYLSKEGIEAAAREQGMVMPGEKSLKVEGLDENGDPVVKGEDGQKKESTSPQAGSEEGDGEQKAGAPANSAEVERAEAAVLDNQPWYYALLDAFFGFKGVEGQAVVSNGAKGE